MHFIEALRLKSKLFFLFLFITLGLIIIGILGGTNTSSMKKNLDALYFGSLVPVTELNDILQTYHNGLANNIYLVRDLHMSPSEFASKTQNLWESYENHFKRDNELQYVEYTAHEIEEINNYFTRLSNAAIDGKDMRRVSLSTLEYKISHIHSVIQKLINYEVKIAQHERRNFLDTYHQTMMQLAIILTIVIIS